MNFTEIILRQLQSCPLLKEIRLCFGGADAKTRSMSILNTKGKYVVEYCDGSRETRFPFTLVYRSPEIDTAGKLAAQELMDNVADWLTDEENLPRIDGVRVLKISRDDLCTLTAEKEDGAVFHGAFVLEYYVEDNTVFPAESGENTNKNMEVI